MGLDKGCSDFRARNASCRVLSIPSVGAGDVGHASWEIFFSQLQYGRSRGRKEGAAASNSQKKDEKSVESKEVDCDSIMLVRYRGNRRAGMAIIPWQYTFIHMNICTHTSTRLYRYAKIDACCKNPAWPAGNSRQIQDHHSPSLEALGRDPEAMRRPRGSTVDIAGNCRLAGSAGRRTG